MDDMIARTVTQLVENTAADLLGNAAARTVSHDRAVHCLTILAHNVQRVIEHELLRSILTADDVALLLDVSARRVRARAAWLNAHGQNVGWHIGSAWLFLPREVDVLRTERGSGRPRKQAPQE